MESKKQKPRRTGNQNEVEVCTALEADGWTVWRPSSPRFFKPYSSADIFGLFDIVAHRDGEIRWIQVKGRSYAGKQLILDIEGIKIPGRKEVWLRSKDGSWNVIYVD